MSFDWGDFSTLSGELLETCEQSVVPKAAIRAALGRTYYALFNVARGLLEARGHDIPRKSAHATVRRVLGESDDARERNLSLTLADLFRLRAMADYDPSPAVPLTLEMARHAYLVGESALKTLRAMAAEESTEPDGQ
jgi:uncharacterized protein (UPF0332 family)